MEELANPFLIKGYASPKYFCDRQKETDKLINALENGRDITLTSPRRMGKSGLIHQAFYKIKEKNPEIKCFYIDLLFTRSLTQLIDLMVFVLFRELDNSITKLYKKIISVISHCRPVITNNSVTGALEISLDIEPGHENHSLKEVFEYLKKSGKRIFIAFDEFQQITEYSDKGVEALLRSYIQFVPNATFIYAGSQSHMMHTMFYDSSKPFFQSAQTMHLYPIEKKVYYVFCKDFFDKAGKTLEEDAFGYVYDSVMGHTWYIQNWMNRLYASPTRIIDIKVVKNTLTDILEDESYDFYSLLKKCTPAQVKVLLGIAKLRNIKFPLNSNQISSLKMGAPSTVRSCIKTLEKDEFLVENHDNYSIYNRYFALWLTSMYSK